MSPEKCTKEGCTNRIKIKKHGLCSHCYARWWINSVPGRKDAQKQRSKQQYARMSTDERVLWQQKVRRREKEFIETEGKDAFYKKEFLRNKAAGRYQSPTYRFSGSKRQARTRGIPWQLTFEQYHEITSQPCFYCEEAIDKQVTGKLDRIINDRGIGYTPNNVLPCCKICNRVRGDHYTVEETKTAVMAVKALRARKSQGTA